MGHTTRLHKRWRQTTETTIVEPVQRIVTPAAQKMIDTYELDASLIVGTGANGNVIVKDVNTFLKAQPSSEEE